MDSHRDTFEPGSPPPPPGVRPDTWRVALVWVAGLIAVLLVVLIVVLVAGDDEPGIAVDTSFTEASSTSDPGAAVTTLAASTTNAAAVTTAAAATTAAPATTGTTITPMTIAPLSPLTVVPMPVATTADQICPEPDLAGVHPSGWFPTEVSDIEVVDFDGYTRITFVGNGQVAFGCVARYEQGEELSLKVRLFPIDVFDPFPAGIFDIGGFLDVGSEAVNWVESQGQGGGSGEWWFKIKLIAPSRPFTAQGFSEPSRVVINIYD